MKKISYTVKDVSLKYGVSPVRIYNAIREGRLHPIEEMGKPYLFNREYIHSLVVRPKTKLRTTVKK